MGKAKKYTKLILNLVLPMVGIILAVIFIPKLLLFFMPFVVGWIISLIANPLVRVLEHRLKIVRKTGSAIVIVLTLAVVILLLYGGISAVADQIQALTKDVPAMAEEAKTEYGIVKDSLEGFYEKLPEKNQEKIVKVTDNISDYIMDYTSNLSFDGMADKASDAISNIPSILIGVIVGFLAAYFFIAQKHELEQFISSHCTRGMKEKYRLIKTQLFDVLGGYFKAQFKIMAVVYVILAVGLGFLRTPYFLLSSLGIAFVDMLPFFGTGTILGPWAIIKILTGNYKMAVVLVVLYGITQLVRQLIQPKLLGDSIGMNPFATLFFMYFGYQLAGVLGMILAVPIAMIILNLGKAGVFDTMIYSAKTLYKDLKDFLHIDLPKVNKIEDKGKKD